MARRVVYNDDSQGVGEADPATAEADLRAWVDRPLSEIPVDTYAWCIAMPDIVMHDSKVGEVQGRRFDSPPDRCSEVIAELRRRGTDVMHVVADQAHRHGVEVVASMRMSDTHHRQPDPDSSGVPQLLLDHPEYAIRRQDGIQETALDYSVPEVREHRLAILRELAEGYDVDGLELDFMRWGKHFAREEAPFKIDVMTDFVGRVREILDEAARRRGRDRLVLGAQVPRSLYLSLVCGLDPRTWVTHGWLDYIIQCDFNCTDPQVPVAEFASFCRDSQCTHHVRMGNMMGGRWNSKPHVTGRKTAYKGSKGYGGMLLTPEEACGAAANIYGFGADGVGFWNLCCNMGMRHKPTAHPGVPRAEFQQDIIDWAREAADPEKVWGGRRVYHFLPIYKGERLMVRNYAVNGLRTGPFGESTQIVILRPEGEGFRHVFRFLMADGKDGRPLKGTLRWRVLQSTPQDKVSFDLNGHPLDADQIRSEAVADDELPYVWHEVDLAGCPPLAGENELGIRPLKLATHRPAPDGKAFPYEEFPYIEELIATVEP